MDRIKKIPIFDELLIAGLNNEKWKSDFLPKFRKLRYTYLDEAPTRKMSPDDENYNKYKFRNNWWNGIVMILERIKRKKTKGEIDIDDTTMAKIEEFLKFIKSIDFDSEKIRTREEINKANNYLDNLINLLSN